MAIKISDLAKIASKTSYVPQAIKRDLNKQGLSPDRTVSDKKGEKIAESWKEKGLVKKTYRSAGNIVRETHKYLAEKNKQDDGPKLSTATLREEREEEWANKEKMRKMMSNIYGQERSREEEKEKGDGKVKRNVATSALKPKAAPGRAETTTSILRSQKTAEKKSAPEEKPQAIDLVID